MPTRHAVFGVLLAAGVLLRIAATLAYRPALIYYDSQAYLTNARHLVPEPVRPAGYPVFLHGILGVGTLATIPLVQHLLGLAIGVLIYVLLLRLGAPGWLAALGAAPVLLDGFQLNIEQFILSETLFELLIVGACVLLLWQKRPSVVLAAGAGLLVALAAVTRSVGEAVLVPVLIAALALTWRRPWPALALVGAFLVPLAAYAAWYHSAHGSYALTGAGGRFLYARVAPIADCSKLDPPADERILCPPQPLGARYSPGKYMWSKGKSPVFRVAPGERNALAGRFAKRVIRHQPLDYARMVGKDSLKGFAPAGVLGGNDAPDLWRFTADYPTFGYQTKDALHHYGYRKGEVRPALARALRAYQGVAYAWGPLLAACLLVALAAIIRPRRPGLRTATFLFAAAGAVVLVGAVAANDFTWRYRLPLVALLPPAAALAVTALRRP